MTLIKYWQKVNKTDKKDKINKDEDLDLKIGIEKDPDREIKTEKEKNKETDREKKNIKNMISMIVTTMIEEEIDDFKIFYSLNLKIKKLFYYKFFNLKSMKNFLNVYFLFLPFKLIIHSTF